ncbi:MAG: 50S ribosomal protein L6 [Candidatus Hydrothermarchaeales archaeon]
MLSLKIEEVIEIPEGISIEVEDGDVCVKGPKGEVTKELHYPGIKLHKEDDSVIIETENPKKIQKALVGTYASHIKNMIKGVTEGFEYKLKIVYAHFPMSVKVGEGIVEINNFLGEKVPRTASIVGNSTVSVKGSAVVVTGNSIEDVGQTAGNIELATKVKKRDRRVFQDGIYLIERNGIPIR